MEVVEKSLCVEKGKGRKKSEKEKGTKKLLETGKKRTKNRNVNVNVSLATKSRGVHELLMDV